MHWSFFWYNNQLLPVMCLMQGECTTSQRSSGGPVLSWTSCLVSTSLHLIPPLPVLLDYSVQIRPTNGCTSASVSTGVATHSRWQACSCQELQQVLVRTDTVLFCATDKVLPPLKIARPSTPETLHCCIGFSVHGVVFGSHRPWTRCCCETVFYLFCPLAVFLITSACHHW